MKAFAFTSIRRKLLAVYLPLIILPTVVIIFIIYHLFSNEVDRTSHLYAKQTVGSINRHLDTYLDELERISLFPYYHSDVMDILQSEQAGSLEEKYREYVFFNDMFSSIMLYPREDLLNVTLYREDGRRYFNTRVYTNLNINYDWKSSTLYRKTLEKSGKVLYSINLDDDDRFNVLRHNIFSVSRLIKSESGKNLGVILIDANFQGITEVLQTVGLGEESNVVLMDANNKIVYAKNERYLNELDLSTSNAGKMNVQGETLYIETERSDKTGWFVSAIIPSHEIHNSFVSVREIILLVLVLFGIITIIVTVWFSGNLSRPIHELQGKMKMVESGDYNVSLDVTRQDEIGNLGQAFNKMSYQIKVLIHEVYEYNIKQKQAELNNLKMQIRPHFLYNTLESMRSLAEINDNRDIVEMATSLGSILRYSIKNHEKLVPIEKEIDFVHQYINIQRIMFADGIKVEYDIDSNLLKYYSIPLVFQPIIENAFQHGLYGKREGGLIRIEGRKEGKELHFIIIDNGKGISPEQLETINQELQFSNQEQEKEVNSTGIGLNNVNQRLKIVFSETYGLFLESTPNEGTSVHITFPIVNSKP
ncbi:sensor histidine kinase [Gracilibacillus sp. D59]|uniref:sensor histidine kinase n=1 Tax=Gracilibacillus sp. D59 TaxID=3457434 RepID=UPI003FCECC00